MVSPLIHYECYCFLSKDSCEIYKWNLFGKKMKEKWSCFSVKKGIKTNIVDLRFWDNWCVKRKMTRKGDKQT